ncbi:MAG TPA: helical backbone metal receptor [Solirubrobacteraceae bacterium]
MGRAGEAVVDAAGTTHARAGADARIVCLVPSITELVCDLGLADRLVGRTGFCIHPWETVRRIPKVGGTKDVKLERICELAPTHVIVNVEENRRETAEALAEFVPEIVVTYPREPRDNLELYRLLGAIFGREAEAQRLCERFQDAAATLAERSWPSERVLYLIWREPWMTVSTETYISRTLALRGWETQPPSTSPPYPEVSLADFPGEVDRVLLSSEPYHFHERHLSEVAKAVPDARVSLIDGEMTSWYGSRAIAGMRYLAAFP